MCDKAIQQRVNRALDAEFMVFAKCFERNILHGVFRMRGLRDPADVRQDMMIKIWMMTTTHSPDRGPIEAYIGQGLRHFISSEFRRLRASSRHVGQMTTVSLEQAREAASNGIRSSNRKSDGSRLIGGDDGALCENTASFEVMHDLERINLTEAEEWYAYAALHGVSAAEASELLGVSHATQCRTRARLARKMSDHVGYEVSPE